MIACYHDVVELVTFPSLLTSTSRASSTIALGGVGFLFFKQITFAAYHYCGFLCKLSVRTKKKRIGTFLEILFRRPMFGMQCLDSYFLIVGDFHQYFLPAVRELSWSPRLYTNLIFSQFCPRCREGARILLALSNNNCYGNKINPDY